MFLILFRIKWRKSFNIFKLFAKRWFLKRDLIRSMKKESEVSFDICAAKLALLHIFLDFLVLQVTHKKATRSQWWKRVSQQTFSNPQVSLVKVIRKQYSSEKARMLDRKKKINCENLKTKKLCKVKNNGRWKIFFVWNSIKQFSWVRERQWRDSQNKELEKEILIF